MSPFDRRVALVVAAAVLATTVAGCGGDDDRSSEDGPEATTTTFLIETDDGTQAISGNDEGGTFFFDSEEGKSSLSFDLDGDGVVSEGESGTFSLSGRSPDGWPDDFPLPAGAEPLEGSSLEAGPLTQLTTIYLVPLPASETFAFYEERMTEPGTWTDVRNADEATFDASLSFTGSHTGFLIVHAGPGGTEVAVQLMVES